MRSKAEEPGKTDLIMRSQHMKMPQIDKWMNDLLEEKPQYYLLHWQVVPVSFDKVFPGDASGYVFVHLVLREEGKTFVRAKTTPT